MNELINALAEFFVDHSTLVGMSIIVAISFFSVRSRSKKSNYAKKKLQSAIDSQNNEPATLHPEIDPALCAGCAACTRVCPEGDILNIINHKAVLVSPTKCVGHGECERSCPTNAIKLVFGTKTRGMDIPRISTEYETNVPGVYIAGELGGMGLIRNAVKQGHLAAKSAIENLDQSKKSDTDLLIVGAGPAGLAASLTAIAEKKSYITIEQGSFGGTVFNYPRQKIIMTHPAKLPLIGTMKFSKNRVAKEELLEYWDEVRKKAGVQIREHVRFEGFEQKDGLFHINTSTGPVTAKKVILCMGVRGTPRRLGLKNEDSGKVTYNLIDPEQYQEMHITVVGGGNAGVESAQMLAKPEYRNKVTLLIRGATFDRCNETNKQIILDMEKNGLVQIWYNSSVKEIEKDSLLVTKEGSDLKIPNHFLFVFAGAEIPYKFLNSLGIVIDKKFGEALLKRK